jgi:ubiquinone/menaquinone biosynthesis C-methylase UbiE
VIVSKHSKLETSSEFNMVLDVDKKYLKEEQYKSSTNLSARIIIHQKFRTNPESFYGWIWKNYEIKNPVKILEVGCGTGEFWLENFSKLPPGSEILMTDFSEGMIEKAKSKIDFDHIKFEVVDIDNLPYPDDSFDIVMAHHVIYHASDKNKAISELKRVVKSDGFISITTNSEKHMLNVYTIAHSIDENFSMVRNIDGFTEEDADTLLKKHFSNIEKTIYEDMLEVNDLEFMVDYIKSTTEPRKMNLRNDFYEKYSEIVKHDIEENGHFDILKRSPLFICKK